MKLSDLQPFLGQKVVLVVQGHLMTGVLSADAKDPYELVVLTSNDNPLYQPTTLVSVANIGAVRAYATSST